MNKKYPKEIEKIREDIESLEIQGATNVAIETFKGIDLFLENKWGNDSIKDLVNSCVEIGEYLASARDNEPLARNGTLFLREKSKNMYMERMSIEDAQKKIKGLVNEYLDLISSSKDLIAKKNVSSFGDYENVLTHCHSSTAVRLLKELSKGRKREDFGVVCTETRPRFQGRITAKSLLDANIETTLIADSAAESFVIGRGSGRIDAIFVGCDQFTRDGYMINKIGSWGIAMAAHYAGKPIYVVTPLLKMDPNESASEIEIEVREDKELWKDAPRDLHMYNPAFEIVDKSLITGFVTEEGLLKPNELEEITRNKYGWLFSNNLSN